jgi:predicted anti-sigma-YlaC factor YlaD
MPLSKKQMEGLMRLVGLTKDSEINCDECLSLVAEFAEQALAGKPIPEGLRAVEHHLSVCSECREEYEALRRALDDLAEETDDS